MKYTPLKLISGTVYHPMCEESIMKAVSTNQYFYSTRAQQLLRLATVWP